MKKGTVPAYVDELLEEETELLDLDFDLDSAATRVTPHTDFFNDRFVAK